jgi:hypothetical protein
MACSSCGKRSGRFPTTMQSGDGAAPRVVTTSPVRYTVNGKRFSTLTAAQDYARNMPGAVIRQV